MAGEEIKAVRELLAAFPMSDDMSIDDLRLFMDQNANMFPLPEGISVEEVVADGVRGEWVKTPGAGADTVILYLHGGGYVIGSPTSHRPLVAAISDAAAATMLSLDYRLAPEHPFPAAVNDAVAGYRWLINQGIAPNRIAVAGDSAGGGLTVATLLSLRDAGDPLPAAGICLSPWVDLTCSGKSYETRAEADPLVNQKGGLQMATTYYGDKDPKTPLASPLFADLSGLPPLLIHVGNDEVLLDDSTVLHQRATEVSVDATLEVWEDMIHVWHMFFPMLKEGRDAIARIGEYFKARVG